LPFNQAIRLPIVISKKVLLYRALGNIIIEGEPKFASIRIGFGDVGIIDYKYNRTIWDVSGKVIFKGNAEIGYGSKIAVGKDGLLEFGKNFIITANSSIIAFKDIRFGDNCQISWDVLIMDTDLHNIMNNAGEVVNSPKPISIGNSVWIGCRCLITKGVKIPDQCIIGANSQVYKTIENENAVYAGNPIKCIMENATWKI
jgi:acetyltransferase-like isoleucine patch superfamily enzyme